MLKFCDYCGEVLSGAVFRTENHELVCGGECLKEYATSEYIKEPTLPDIIEAVNNFIKEYDYLHAILKLLTEHTELLTIIYDAKTDNINVSLPKE